jgi:hypothetical protein
VARSTCSGRGAVVEPAVLADPDAGLERRRLGQRPVPEPTVGGRGDGSADLLDVVPVDRPGVVGLQATATKATATSSAKAPIVELVFPWRPICAKIAR